MTEDEWYDRPCVVCDCPNDDFKQGMAVGELTIGDVNMELEEDGPVCSRECMFELPDDVYPYSTYSIADRFKPGGEL